MPIAGAPDSEGNIMLQITPYSSKITHTFLVFMEEKTRERITKGEKQKPGGNAQ